MTPEAEKKKAIDKIKQSVTSKKDLLAKYRSVFNSPDGKEVLNDILASAGINKYKPGLTHDALLKEDGKRELAFAIVTKLGWQAEDFFAAAYQRVLEREKALDDAEESKENPEDAPEKMRSAMNFNPTE